MCTCRKIEMQISGFSMKFYYIQRNAVSLWNKWGCISLNFLHNDICHTPHSNRINDYI